ncbi:hypothetical protein ACN2WE_01770 [Streptomyces sp. cg28]|uniref:hypothetical protein n=1 Tax=Streptomyces sp. cg28 TaxID=3403457 RepID=UPI003B20F9C5
MTCSSFDDPARPLTEFPASVVHFGAVPMEALPNRRLAQLVLHTLKPAGRLLDRRGHSVAAAPLNSVLPDGR